MDAIIEDEMPDILIGIFLFIALVVVASLLFGGWVLYTIVRLIGRGLMALRRSGPHHGAFALTCTRPGCRADNPTVARFCRRCGAGLEQARTSFRYGRPVHMPTYPDPRRVGVAHRG